MGGGVAFTMCCFSIPCDHDLPGDIHELLVRQSASLVLRWLFLLPDANIAILSEADTASSVPVSNTCFKYIFKYEMTCTFLVANMLSDNVF